MVFFSCDGCGEMLKKAKVDAHAARCYDCASVSCVDCGVSFWGNDYRKHTTCISEAERYEKTIYKGPKKGSKANPQEQWMDLIYSASEDAPNDLKTRLVQLTELGDNVPRKEKQFRNFVGNSLKLHDTVVVTKIWNYLMKKKEDTSKSQKNEILQKGDIKQIKSQSNQGHKSNSEIVTSVDASTTADDKHNSNSVNNRSEISSKQLIKTIKKILKAEPEKSMKIKDLRSKLHARLGCDKKSLKRLMNDHLIESKPNKKFKVEGKVATLIK